MASQVALHPELENPFFFVGGEKSSADLCDLFESGKVLIFDQVPLPGMDYFLSHPGRWYPDWIPPIFSSMVQKPLNESHALHAICENDADILNFQAQAQTLESAWSTLVKGLFPDYQWDYFSFSYRLNHMALGNLHLDVPDTEYEGHQFRWFINLDTRPRILAIGPSVFELARMFWEERNLATLRDLPVHEFIKQFRRAVLDTTVFKERELPRHYLTLDPGSMWLSHSSYISHGLVYGRKTACLEGRVHPSTLRNPRRHFNSMIRALQKHGPRSERELEEVVGACL